MRRKAPNRKRDSTTGRSRGEAPHIVRAVVLAQRLREVAPEHADNPLAGFALGRLRLRCQPHGPQDPGSISQEQFDAGERYAAIARWHASIMGYSNGTARSAQLEIGGGTSCAPEPDEEVILQVRRTFSDCYRALMDAGRAIGRGVEVALITYDICLDRRRAESLGEEDMGNLKVGLNALAHVFA